jgi:hypothetical protein
MDTTTLTDRRKLAGARRRKPTRPEVFELPANDGGRRPREDGPRPSELRLETTYPGGRIVEWFEDNWWLETLRLWKDRRLAIHILPTPDALLHPIVLHEIEMIRRMETPWTVIGHCYLSDVNHPTLVSRVATSPYDEVRIIDALRPVTDEYDVRPGKFSIAEFLDQVRAAQITERAVTPLLTKAPDPNR